MPVQPCNIFTIAYHGTRMSKSKLSATSQNHVIVTQAIKGIIGVTVPALYIESSGKPQIVNSLISYFLANPDRSVTWMRTRARAVGAFYDYCAALSSNNMTPTSYQNLLAQFGISIANGTINPQTGIDQLRLYWPPSSIENAKRLTRALQDFIEWCSYKDLIPSEITARREQLPTDEKTYLRYLFEASQAKSFMFLGHTLKTTDIARKIAKTKQLMPVSFASKSQKVTSAKKFPNQYVSLLLKDGFVKNPRAYAVWDREDITAKMITILMLFGGTRHSEPYHIWFNDVIPQIDGTCKVFLRHPSESATFLPGEEEKSRKQYLFELGLLPRNSQANNKCYKAGWKNLQVDDDYSAPIHFIHPPAEKMFQELYISYIKHYRPKLMAQRSTRGGYPHPFLFVNKWNGDIGAPYSMAAYKSALTRAYERVNRIHGLSINQSKQAGTSPHGMRHYYGHALTELGMDVKIIQRCFRHRTVHAQSVYTEPDGDKIRSELNKAMLRMRTGILFPTIGNDIQET